MFIQLMDKLVNVSHSGTIAIIWIFDPNYKISPPLEKEYFYLISDASKSNNLAVEFN